MTLEQYWAWCRRQEEIALAPYEQKEEEQKEEEEEKKWNVLYVTG